MAAATRAAAPLPGDPVAGVTLGNEVFRLGDKVKAQFGAGRTRGQKDFKACWLDGHVSKLGADGASCDLRWADGTVSRGVRQVAGEDGVVQWRTGHGNIICTLLKVGSDDTGCEENEQLFSKAAVPGNLKVRVLAAHSLKNTDTGLFGDVSDPYVRLTIGTHEFKTKVIDNNLNPKWTVDNEFAVDVGPDDRILKVEVWNSNYSADDSLGNAEIDIRRLKSSISSNKRVVLQEGSGEVELDVTFTPGKPASSSVGARAFISGVLSNLNLNCGGAVARVPQQQGTNVHNAWLAGVCSRLDPDCGDCSKGLKKKYRRQAVDSGESLAAAEGHQLPEQALQPEVLGQETIKEDALTHASINVGDGSRALLSASMPWRRGETELVMPSPAMRHRQFKLPEQPDMSGQLERRCPIAVLRAEIEQMKECTFGNDHVYLPSKREAVSPTAVPQQKCSTVSAKRKEEDAFIRCPIAVLRAEKKLQESEASQKTNQSDSLARRLELQFKQIGK